MVGSIVKIVARGRHRRAVVPVVFFQERLLFFPGVRSTPAPRRARRSRR